MAWSAITTKVKDAVFGFQSYNIISDDLNYLKTQTEVLVAANGTTIKDNSVPEAGLKVSNTPTDGYVLVARSNATGNMTWENTPGGLKSLQRGTIAIAANAVSGNATISAVTMNKTFISHLGVSGVAYSYDQHCRLELTSTTNVLATFGGTGVPINSNATVGFEVVEFN